MASLRSRRETPKRTGPSLFAVPKKPPPRRKYSISSVVFGAFLVVSVMSFLLGLIPQEQHRDNQSGEHHNSFFSDTTKQAFKKDKTGKVLHRSITSVKKGDLEGLVDDAPLPREGGGSSSVSYEEAVQGRERIVEILKDAGVTDIDVETVQKLPKWSSVTKLYGEGPVVVGLETCEKFRTATPLDDASVGTAGIFNTGTNPFAMYLEANCVMPHNTNDKHGGMRWQV